MRRKSPPSPDGRCLKCGFKIPPNKRSDAAYCGTSCRDAAEKYRYKQNHPDYVERQRVAVKTWGHLDTFGHTRYMDDPSMNKRDKFRHARKEGYRSGLEVSVARDLEKTDVPFEYEQHRIHFTHPARRAFYTPDYVLENGIVVETKGRFTVQDRAKHLIIKEQYPDLDLRFVFSNSNNRISKASKTTYAMWCRKHGFMYADKLIPDDWKKEQPDDARIAALTTAGIK